MDDPNFIDIISMEPVGTSAELSTVADDPVTMEQLFATYPTPSDDLRFSLERIFAGFAPISMGQSLDSLPISMEELLSAGASTEIRKFMVKEAHNFLSGKMRPCVRLFYYSCLYRYTMGHKNQDMMNIAKSWSINMIRFFLELV